MDTITHAEACANLAQTIEQVCEDHTPIIITDEKSQAVVMMSLEDYHALEETAYLLRTPKNAHRLLTAIFELERGQGQERTLIEE